MVRLVQSGASDITGLSTVQLRQLPAQATGSSTVTVSVPVPAGATTGTYAVYMEAPDAWSSTNTRRAYKIRLANAANGTQVWDDTNGRMASGTKVTIN
jgi:hypothetical protein